MANLIPFNRRLFGSFDNDFNSMLDDFFKDSMLPARRLDRDTFKVDVISNENDYIVEAELPGVNKDAVTLDYNDGRLVISVTEESENTNEGKNYIHKERRVSSASRSVYLADASQDEIVAKLEDGILKITVPKQSSANKSRKIEIN